MRNPLKYFVMNLNRYSLSRRLVPTFILFGILIFGAVYLWEERYFLRFLPIPHNSIDILYKEDGTLPIYTPMVPAGQWNFPIFDLTTDRGLRAALNHIQLQSPTRTDPPRQMNYEGITFQSWIDQLGVTPFLCTDASMLFMLIAWKQGLIAREWQLLAPGWTPGQGHSVVEFYDPHGDRWVLVDPQHAGIVKDKTGQPLDMKSVIAHYVESGNELVVVDYGPYSDAIYNNDRGPTTEDYFFVNKGLSVPVLQLRQPTWLAKARQNDLIIGYPIIISPFVHDTRVYTTKIIAGFLLIVFLLLCFAVFKIIVRRRWEGPASTQGKDFHK